MYFFLLLPHLRFLIFFQFFKIVFFSFLLFISQIVLNIFIRIFFWFCFTCIYVSIVIFVLELMKEITNQLSPHTRWNILPTSWDIGPTVTNRLMHAMCSGKISFTEDALQKYIFIIITYFFLDMSGLIYYVLFIYMFIAIKTGLFIKSCNGQSSQIKKHHKNCNIPFRFKWIWQTITFELWDKAQFKCDGLFYWFEIKCNLPSIMWQLNSTIVHFTRHKGSPKFQDDGLQTGSTYISAGRRDIGTQFQGLATIFGVVFFW